MVERIVRRPEPGHAVRPRGAVLIGHELQRAREVRLHELFPGARHAVVRQEDRGVRLPTPVFVLMRGDRGGKQWVNGKAFPCIADRRCGDVGEAHRAVALQRGYPSVGRGRYDGAQHAVGDFAPVLTHEDVGRQRFRPPAKARDALDGSIGQPDHDRRDARDVDQVRLQHGECDAGGAAGVDRIAAGFED